MTSHAITYRSKYELIGDLTACTKGRLVDVGARDRILKNYLRSPSITYVSADVVEGHDYLWDLEKPIDCPNNAFEFVTALDVLEHLEFTHNALYELIRITRYKLYITLPNMACLYMRFRFLTRGYLNGKYELRPEHQGDRHRWLTTYYESCNFVNIIASRTGCSVKQFDIIQGFQRMDRIAIRFPIPLSLRTSTLLFEITKPAV